MQSNTFIDLAGWLGVAVLLAAYGLVSAKKLAGDSYSFQLLNLIGSALLIMNSFYYGALPSVVVNLVWIGIAILTIIRRKSACKTR